MPSPSPSCSPSLDAAGYEPGRSMYYAAISDAVSSAVTRNPNRFNSDGTKLLNVTTSRAWFFDEIGSVLRTYNYCVGTKDEWIVLAGNAAGPFEAHALLRGDKIQRGEPTPFDCAYEDGYTDGVNTFSKCPGSFQGLLVLQPGREQ